MEVGKRKRKVRAALDTQSNVTYANSEVGVRREWGEGEVKTVRGLGGLVGETVPLSVVVCKGKERIKLKARSAPKGLLERGCELLLSAGHCSKLGIDVNYVLSHLPHLPVRYRKGNGSQRNGDGQRNGERKRGKGAEPWKWASCRTLRKHLCNGGVSNTRGLSKEQLTDLWQNNKAECHRCLLAERKVAAYMQMHKDEKTRKATTSLEDIDIAIERSSSEYANIMNILREYEDVFSTSPESLPMKGVPLNL